MQERTQRTPALFASVLLHGGLLALAFIAVKAAPPLLIPTEPVSVSIVSGEPNVAPALQSRTPSPPQAEEPAPAIAAPGPEAVEPRPAPAPAAPAPPVKTVSPLKPPTPAPTPKAKPTPPRPEALNLDKLSASLPKAQARAKPALDLDALSNSLPAKAARSGAGSLNLDALADSLPAGHRGGNGAKGPPRPETALKPRQATGAATGLSGNELGALQAKLNRLWNPNCGVEGAGAVVVKVAMHLAPDGSLSARPQIASTGGEAPSGVVQAAAARAVSAVSRGAPYDEISPEHLKNLNNFIVKFDAKSVCSR